MDLKLSPEEAKSVIEAVTRLLSNTPEPSEAKMSPEDYHSILVAGSSSDDALPDLTVLHKAELDCFCSLYNGADLSVDRIFTLFQIHMAFTDRNENDAKRLFKFGVLDAYCEMTGRNKGLSKKKQDWTLNLDALQHWVTNETKKLNEEPALAPSKVLETTHDTSDAKQPTETCRESRHSTSRKNRKGSREEATGAAEAEKDLEDVEGSEVPRKKRKVKASSTRKSVRRVAEPKVKKQTRSKKVG
ncbi:hypothetical protein DL98DRAFT_529821 [Cadophora sp. DSE1049]|nr:hypothetical protein DL98DRAFT_529821 [Cadophora sp. DSE1049]